MMHRGSRAALAVLVALLPLPARAEFRHGLVIGQSNYRSGPLVAPSQDVEAVAEALVKRGFTVTKAVNVATVGDLTAAVNAFASGVPTGGTALIYFSGRTAGVPVATGAQPPRVDTGLVALDGQAYPLATVLGTLTNPGLKLSSAASRGGTRIAIVIVDGVPQPAAAASPAAAHLDPPAGGIVMLGPEPRPAGDSRGPSPLAGRLVASLSGSQSLDTVLSGLSPRTLSAVDAGELARLSAAASRAVSPPDTLAPGPHPGAEWVDKRGMVFCWCPPGASTIGSPPTEPGRQPNERQAIVAFDEGFWMAKHEMCHREGHLLGFGKAVSVPDRLQPFNAITGNDVDAMLARANAAAPPGWEYGVPTEAEWEYAARAGASTAYSFGDDPADLVRHGNFADRTLRTCDEQNQAAKAAGQNHPHPHALNGDLQTGLFTYAHPTLSDGTALTARVGSYLPNAWGLCDMQGNVSEMTITIHDPHRLGPVVPVPKHAAWAASPEAKQFPRGRVFKGGSWASAAATCRPAFRGSFTNRELITGLRLVLRRGGAATEAATRWTTLVPTAVTTTSGATATPAADGTVAVTGTAAPGDTYTITCPVPTGVEPFSVRLEVFGDAATSIAEVSIAGTRGSGTSRPLEVLHAGTSLEAAAGSLIDGQPGTAVKAPADGREREAVFTIGLPTRTGSDRARWAPLESRTQGAMSTLTVTIAHAKSAATPLRTFRLSMRHDDRTATPDSSPAALPASKETPR